MLEILSDSKFNNFDEAYYAHSFVNLERSSHYKTYTVTGLFLYSGIDMPIVEPIYVGSHT